MDKYMHPPMWWHTARYTANRSTILNMQINKTKKGQTEMCLHPDSRELYAALSKSILAIQKVTLFHSVF